MDPFEVADRYSAGCADIHGRVRYRRRTQAMNACIHDEASSQEARLALRLEASFRLALLPVLRCRACQYSITIQHDDGDSAPMNIGPYYTCQGNQDIIFFVFDMNFSETSYEYILRTTVPYQCPRLGCML